jgi:crotonobetainyl-CoA:carnitine CoA-transferase CaiB-like acyl-CoA transferase
MMLEQPNRNKRSMGLDISTDGGREILYRLVEQADVFITNMLPALRQRLQIDVEHLRARNPRIVYVRGSAYGPRGPLADLGGFDATAYWFGGGFADAFTAPGADEPVQQRGGIGDVPSGGFLAGGVAAALFQRERTGEAPVVDVSLLSAAVWTLSADVLASALVDPEVGALPWTRHNPPNPMSNTYRTSDGRWLSLAMYQHGFWAELCALLDRPELADDPRFADGALRHEHTEACVAALDEAFGSFTLDEIAARLDAANASWGPMRTAREVHDLPQVAANGYLPSGVGNDGYEFEVASGPVQFDETPTVVRMPAPELGQHTEEILLELGLGWDAIEAYKSAGAIL